MVKWKQCMMKNDDEGMHEKMEGETKDEKKRKKKVC